MANLLPPAAIHPSFLDIPALAQITQIDLSEFVSNQKCYRDIQPIRISIKYRTAPLPA